MSKRLERRSRDSPLIRIDPGQTTTRIIRGASGFRKATFAIASSRRSQIPLDAADQYLG